MLPADATQERVRPTRLSECNVATYSGTFAKYYDVLYHAPRVDYSGEVQFILDRISKYQIPT
jgi:hypothetical protein